jgi:hydroxyacylglutathione hydrolase
VPTSTLGYERIANWAFGVATEDAFVEAVLAGQPEPPKYFAEMKRINKAGPRILGGRRRPERLPVARFAGLLRQEALVVDVRPAADFAAGHIPGTISIPHNRSFTTWAGWLIPYDRDFYLVCEHQHPQCVDDAVRDLMLIGLDRVAGYLTLEESELEAWREAGGRLDTIAQIGPEELAERLRGGETVVIDVRGRAEWDAGHLPGVPNIPLGYLTDRLAEVPSDKTVVFQCQTGRRSAIAASLLQARGRTNVVNLAGGYAGWARAGLPVESATEPAGARA